MRQSDGLEVSPSTDGLNLVLSSLTMRADLNHIKGVYETAASREYLGACLRTEASKADLRSLSSGHGRRTAVAKAGLRSPSSVHDLRTAVAKAGPRSPSSVRDLRTAVAKADPQSSFSVQ